MSFKSKIKQKILKSSDMYNFYESEYKNTGKKINELEDKLKSHEKTLNSYQNLFNTLYLDYELTPKGMLEGVQDICIELLIFVSNICKKYELEWWLDYGNLLGAVRHGNFVPWDDDMDIGMMREDYNKFINAVHKEVEEKEIDWIDIRWRKRKIDGKTTWSFIQIFLDKPGFSHTLAQVDVFPYDYIEDFTGDIEDYKGENLNNIYFETKMSFYRDLIKGYDIEKVLKRYYKNLNLSHEKEEYLLPGVEGSCGPKNLYKLMVLETDKVFPLKTVKFRDYEFPCPNDCDYYLKSIYGNYMRIPKNVRGHGRLNKLRYDDINLLRQSVEELREFNANFK